MLRLRSLPCRFTLGCHFRKSSTSDHGRSFAGGKRVVRLAMTEELFQPAMYEYSIRKDDGSTEAGFHTQTQAKITADDLGLDPNSYSIDRRPVGLWGQESRIDLLKLHAIPEISVILGHLSVYTIRRLAKQGKVEWVKGERNSVLMTEGQIAALLKHLTQPIRSPEVERPLPNGVDSLTSARSRARAGHR